jgi:2-dehydropantoate 2-reductase
MRTVIVGPGAIGRLFAGCLHTAGETVALLDHDPERARALDAAGIRIEEPVSRRSTLATLKVPVRDDASDWRVRYGFPSFVVICVKSYDTAAAVRHALPLFGPKTTVVSLQNGMGNVELIRGVTPIERILCAVTGHGATLDETGVVHHAGSGLTTVAPVHSGVHDLAAQFAEMLHRCGIEARPIDDCMGMLWSKLIVNAAINPVTALHNVSNGELLNRAEPLETALAAAREAHAVARAAGVRVRFDDPAAEVRRLCARTRDNLSSMLQDVRRGRPTEIDAINGFVVRQADTAGIDVPVNRQLLGAIAARD